MPVKYVPYYAVLLCLCTSIESICIKYIQQLYPVSPPSVVLVFLTEMVKFVIFLGLALIARQVNLARERRRQEIEEERPILEQSILPNQDDPHWTHGFKSLVYLVPAVIYAISNNLVYFALERMSPALFTLLMGLKIPFTGVMAFVFLNKQLTQVKWVSLFLIFLGTTIAMVNPSSSEHNQFGYSVTGVIAVLGYSTCSASAAVYMEWMTQKVRRDECVFKQSTEFAFYSLMTNVVALLVSRSFDWSALRWGHVLSIMSMMLNGLATALVIKYGGSIPKVYSSSMASILTAALSYVIWNKTLYVNYWIGAIMCVMAVHMYAR